jgi:hypothetical protein
MQPFRSSGEMVVKYSFVLDGPQILRVLFSPCQKYNVEDSKILDAAGKEMKIMTNPLQAAELFIY